jgi:hypothetical protein
VSVLGRHLRVLRGIGFDHGLRFDWYRQARSLFLRLMLLRLDWRLLRLGLLRSRLLGRWLRWCLLRRGRVRFLSNAGLRWQRTGSFRALRRGRCINAAGTMKYLTIYPRNEREPC